MPSTDSNLSPTEWLSKCERYCANAEHCEMELRTKFVQWGLTDSKLADEIILSLYKNHFLDNDRYCQSFTHDKVRFQRWGRRKIYAALHAKGLPSNTIQSAIDSIDETEYFHALSHLIQQKKGDDFEHRLAFLLQRGFTYEEITQWDKTLGSNE